MLRYEMDHLRNHSVRELEMDTFGKLMILNNDSDLLYGARGVDLHDYCNTPFELSNFIE